MEHDVDEDDLTDIEDHVEVDRQLDSLENYPQPPPKSTAATLRAQSPSTLQTDTECIGQR